MNKKLNDCNWHSHTAVRVIGGDGLHWYGQIINQMRQVRFVKENSLLGESHQDIKVGDTVEIATIQCPSSFLSFTKPTVLINSVVYKDGEVFMMRRL
jgi:hypothetical protein